MKLFFVIIFAFFGLLNAFLLSSCDRPKPPDYNESRNQTLSQACRLLEQEQFEQAIALLKTADDPELHLLLEMLSELEQERQLIIKANELLKNGQYQELSRLIEQAERSGIASPELLEYRSAPQAIQALQVFCSRMPWEKPEDLENAAKWLRPYLPSLRRAPAFEEFWQQQLAQGERLQQRENTRQQQNLLENIDQLLAQKQYPAAWNTLEKLWQLQPAHQIFGLLEHRQRRLKDNFEQLLHEQAPAPEILELALALTWHALPQQQQEQLRPLLSQTTTLSAAILAAGLFESAELYAIALRRWNAKPENRERFPWFLEKALAKVFFQPGQFNARCWRSPCPNLTDFFARINQIAVNLKQSQDKEK